MAVPAFNSRLEVSLSFCFGGVAWIFVMVGILMLNPEHWQDIHGERVAWNAFPSFPVPTVWAYGPGSRGRDGNLFDVLWVVSGFGL